MNRAYQLRDLCRSGEDHGLAISTFILPLCSTPWKLAAGTGPTIKVQFINWMHVKFFCWACHCRVAPWENPPFGQDLPVIWTRSSRRASGNVDTAMAIKCRWSLGILLLEIADGRGVPPPPRSPPPPPPLSPSLPDGILCVKFCGFRRMFA